MNINIEINLLKDRIDGLEKRIDAILQVIRSMGKPTTKAKTDKPAAE